MPSNSPGRTWTTSGAPAREQLAWWQHVAAEAWVPVAVQRRGGEGAFPSSVAARSVGALQVSEIDTPPQLVTRSAAQAARDASTSLFVNLPLVEGTSATQDGRTARLRPGDFTVVTASRPFRLEYAGHLRQVSVSLPADVLLPRVAHSDRLTAVRVAGDRGVGAVAGQALRALALAGQLDREVSRQLVDNLVALVGLALGGVRSAKAVGSSLLLQAALDEVERSLGKSHLDPQAVADRVGISTRYLHRLFEDHGESFGRHLLARRLNACDYDLVDPARAGWTIAQIALDRGFADPTYFARAYRRRYGRTPTERRRDIASRGPHT